MGTTTLVMAVRTAPCERSDPLRPLRRAVLSTADADSRASVDGAWSPALEAAPLRPVDAAPLRAELLRDEPLRAEPLRAEPLRVEPLRAEPLRAELLRAEPLRAEVLRPELDRPRLELDDDRPLLALPPLPLLPLLALPLRLPPLALRLLPLPPLALRLLPLRLLALRLPPLPLPLLALRLLPLRLLVRPLPELLPEPEFDERPLRDDRDGVLAASAPSDDDDFEDPERLELPRGLVADISTSRGVECAGSRWSGRTGYGRQ
jgi:hypothetical protein